MTDRGEPVQVRGLSFTYRGSHDAAPDRPALNGIDLDLETGELTWLMGRTGAGKSTLCLCLNGVIPAMQPGNFEGEVRVGGERISGRHVYEVAERVGLLFQDFETQLLASDVEREVAFGLENAGMTRAEMRRRVDAALELVGLSELRDRDPATLSGGQKQRLALAAVLAPEPSVIVLDEPTTDLDPRGKRLLSEIVAELSERGVTLLIAEHEADDAIMADSLVALSAGEKHFDGPPGELLNDPTRCRELGVLPLQMAELRERLGLEELPLEPGEVAKALARDGFTLDAAACELLAGQVPSLGEPIIEVEELDFAYPHSQDYALRGVSLSIREGEFVVLLGENGSGKSTIARHLNGLLCPSAGVVRVGGRDTREQSITELASQVGYLFQNPDHQIFSSTVREEVAFGPRNLNLGDAEIAERVARALEETELSGWEERDPFVLTKGERQRVALASVLACRPRVIVFDEPTTGLDGLQQRAMMDLLRRLNQQGQTVIVITHCTWAAAEYAHRAIVLDESRLLADRSVRDVFADDDLLARSGQVAPAIARLTRELGGQTLLSVDEAVGCLRRGGYDE